MSYLYPKLFFRILLKVPQHCLYSVLAFCHLIITDFFVGMQPSIDELLSFSRSEVKNLTKIYRTLPN
jgi:hypothetical protein